MPKYLTYLYRLRWASVFVLGLVAYAPVLSMWFVGDDFSHFRFHEALPGLAPFTTVRIMFYRPLSTFLTWNVGYSLFGTEALPYHIVSLVLHALAAWLLARAVATISSEPRLGWITGALFAVYPLCTEPVAWLAAQWDVWAAVCALAAVWGFAVAWRTRDWRPYVGGLVAATAAVFMKEIALPLPLVLPLVGLATELHSHTRGEIVTPDSGRGWLSLLRRTALFSAPFFLPTLAFVVLRLIYNGSVGGYAAARTDYLHFFWDSFVVAGLNTVMPLNRSVFEPSVVQIVGMAIGTAVLVGLFVWGRKRWPLHLLAVAWWVLFLAPVINLINLNLSSPTNFGNRVYYFSLMAFCLGVAAVLSAALDSANLRWAGYVLVAAIIAVAVPTTWIQLQPWVQASNQTRRLVVEMERVLVPASGQRLQLNVKDLPQEYKGAYVFWNGFDEAMRYLNNRLTITNKVGGLDPNQLASPFQGVGGVYNLAISLDPHDDLYHVSEVSGASIATEPPLGDGRVWDFTTCSQYGGLPWQSNEGAFACASSVVEPPMPGASYATFTPESVDGKLFVPDRELDLEGKTWVRLGVLARLGSSEVGRVGTWFWSGPEGGSPKFSAFALAADQGWRVYWTFVPVGQVGEQVRGLRFDPVDGEIPVDIGWIAITPVE